MDLRSLHVGRNLNMRQPSQMLNVTWSCPGRVHSGVGWGRKSPLEGWPSDLARRALCLVELCGYLESWTWKRHRSCHRGVERSRVVWAHRFGLGFQRVRPFLCVKFWGDDHAVGLLKFKKLDKKLIVAGFEAASRQLPTSDPRLYQFDHRARLEIARLEEGHSISH